MTRSRSEWSLLGRLLTCKASNWSPDHRVVGDVFAFCRCGFEVFQFKFHLVGKRRLMFAARTTELAPQRLDRQSEKAMPLW